MLSEEDSRYSRQDPSPNKDPEAETEATGHGEGSTRYVQGTKGAP